MIILRKYADRALMLLCALLIIACAHGIPEKAQSVHAELSPTQKAVALTFDDGPYTGCTPYVLEALDKYGARATFFVLGERIAGREKLLEQMAAAGCEVGNHGFSHADLTMLSVSECRKEIKRTDDEIERVLGHSAKIVRPPYGRYNAAVISAIDYPVILWTLDTEDWQKNRDPAELARFVVENAEDGMIILMHDQQEATARAMDDIIKGLISRGFALVTASELISRSSGELCAGTVYAGGFSGK